MVSHFVLISLYVVLSWNVWLELSTKKKVENNFINCVVLNFFLHNTAIFQRLIFKQNSWFWLDVCWCLTSPFFTIMDILATRQKPGIGVTPYSSRNIPRGLVLVGALCQKLGPVCLAPNKSSACLDINRV
jgi:hypothetical protein